MVFVLWILGAEGGSLVVLATVWRNLLIIVFQLVNDICILDRFMFFWKERKERESGRGKGSI